jgi:ABC-2 type transport system permease protein
MNKIGIVIQREYLSRVRKKSFILLTLLTPLLFIALIFGTMQLANVSGGETKNIVVADATGEYFPVLQNTEQYRFLKAEGEFEDFRKQSDDAIYATLVISGDLLENPGAITLYSHKQVVHSVENTITSQLNNYLSNKKLESYNIPNLRTILAESQISIDLQTIKWDNSGNENEASAGLATAIGMLFTFLIYMFIFVYGAMVMQGVLEEKTNRIVELMVSSIKPFDLMMGKLMGIGLVGLTQFGLWAVLFLGIGFSGTVFMDDSGIFQKFSAQLTSVNLGELYLYFIVFFIGGYLMYASLFAAIGAMVNSPEDTQQFMTPITIVILFAFYAGFYSSQNPDGPLAFWTSLIPFTAPIVMMTRLPYEVAWWEISLSITLLAATVILIVQIAAKIYRVGILMYGKKPTYGEIIKWLKY